MLTKDKIKKIEIGHTVIIFYLKDGGNIIIKFEEKFVGIYGTCENYDLGMLPTYENKEKIENKIISEFGNDIIENIKMSNKY